MKTLDPLSRLHRASRQLACGLLALAAPSLSATLLFEDSFSYGAGALDGQGGWFGGATQNTIGSNLTSGGLQSSGSGVSYAGDGSFHAEWKSLGTTIDHTVDGTYYMSAIVQTDGAVAYGLNLGTGSFGRPVGMDAVGGSWLSNGSTFAGGVSAGTPTILVGRLDISAAGQDSFTLWIDPSLGAEPGGGAVNNFDLTEDLIYAVLAGNNTGAAALDEIRFGTSWSDVTPVPEPATYALLFGCAAMGLAIYSRTRRRARMA